MLVIVRNKTPPLPVSPHLLWLVMDGLDSVRYDPTFFTAIDEPMAENVATIVDDWDGSLASLHPRRSHGRLGLELVQQGIDVSWLN